MDKSLQKKSVFEFPIKNNRKNQKSSISGLPIKNNRKGQAAMEFLMTYSWAILIVLAAAGALAYFGVMGQGTTLPEKCDFVGQGLTCIDKPSIDATANTVTLAFRNNLGEDITISSVSATDNCENLDSFEVCSVIADCDGTALNNVTTVKNDELFLLQITCLTDGLEGRFKSDVTVSYTNSETGLPHDITGQLRGKA